MQRKGLILVAILLLPSLAAAQSVCYDCHAVHGNIWEGSKDFHAGGVGNCVMCHTMHNSQNGAPVDAGSPGGNPYLLIAATPSDVCLTCHSSTYNDVFGSNPLLPPREVGAGNFVFLLEDNVNDGYGGATSPLHGCATGHNIIAPSRGAGVDPVHTKAPGGEFPADQLGCTSCHDPHGNANFRMLYGAGPVQLGSYVFTAPAPLAEGLSIYHGTERATRHTAYRSGMSEWCGNCHGDFHDAAGTLKHVTGVELGAEVSARYNAYAGTANPTGGQSSTAYLPQVPFEDPSATLASTAGPGPGSRIMCLSCHRAHASSAPDGLRWDPGVTFLALDGQESGSYAQPSPYADPAQRSLCNKCHAKDEFDRLAMP